MLWFVQRTISIENEARPMRWWEKPRRLAGGSGIILSMAAIAIVIAPYLIGEQATPDEKSTGAMPYTLSVTWSSDATKLAGGTKEGFLVLWDSQTGKVIQKFKGHEGPVNHVAWSPNGNMIASSSDDLTVRLWDAETMQLRFTFQNHEAPVQYVTWSPDGLQLASYASDGWIVIWDTASGDALGSVHTKANRCQERNTFTTNCLAWSPDGSLLASSGGDLIASASYTVLDSIPTRGATVDWSPTGEHIVYDTTIWEVNHNGDEIELRETIDFEQEHVGTFGSVKWSPTGTSIATGTSDAIVRIWDVDKWEPTFVLQGHTGWIFETEYSPDGTRLASVNDKEIIIWNVEDGTQIIRIIP